jgi:hypothetical protein
MHYTLAPRPVTRPVFLDASICTRPLSIRHDPATPLVHLTSALPYLTRPLQDHRKACIPTTTPRACGGHGHHSPLLAAVEPATKSITCCTRALQAPALRAAGSRSAASCHKGVRKAFGAACVICHMPSAKPSPRLVRGRCSVLGRRRPRSTDVSRRSE